MLQDMAIDVIVIVAIIIGAFIFGYIFTTILGSGAPNGALGVTGVGGARRGKRGTTPVARDRRTDALTIHSALPVDIRTAGRARR